MPEQLSMGKNNIEMETIGELQADKIYDPKTQRLDSLDVCQGADKR